MNSQKHLFTLDPGITYLNCAYMSPLMKTVAEAGFQGILKKQQPSTVAVEDFFDDPHELRKEFSKLVDCPDPNRIAVIPSVSYGFANVANNLKLEAGDEIIVLEGQFPSNIYSWVRLAEKNNAKIITIDAPTAFHNRGKIWNERILEAINPKTKMVACAHIHWSDGTLYDLKSIRLRTREVGAWLVIDGTQSLGALPFSVQEIQPDALVAAGYKSLMGPYSIGLAYYGEAFDDGIPVEENWINRFESENFANLVNYNPNYQPGALRYGVGEQSNFILVPMMLEALRVLNAIGSHQVQEYCADLVREPIQVLQEKGFLIEEESFRASNLFGIRLPDILPVSDAEERIRKANIFISYRGDAIRISPGIYNEPGDLDKLVNVLTS